MGKNFTGSTCIKDRVCAESRLGHGLDSFEKQ
jgi:hypothetical protein